MAIDAVTNKQLGITLWIHFQSGFTSLVNNDVKDFASLEAVVDASGAAARQVNFALQPARPVSNAQMRNPGAKNSAFISGEEDTIVEKTATAKQMDVVGEFDYDVYMRAEQDPSQIYVGPMGMAVDNLMFNAKEHMLIQYYGDGSGAQAQLHSTPSLTVVNVGSLDEMSFVIGNTSAYLGTIYNIREEQKLVAYHIDGTAHAPSVTAGTVAYLKVTSVVNSGATKTVQVAAYSAADVKLDITAATTVAASDVLYNYSDVANGGVFNRSAITDFGGLLYMPGLRALSAADGSVCNGVTLSGAYAGSELDIGGSTNLYFTDLGKLFSKINRRVAEGKYDYPQLKCSFDTWNYLVNLDEGSKFLKPVVEQSPNGRGEKKYMYYHNDIACAVVGRRFVADSDIWAEPKLMDSMSVPGVTKEGPIMFKFTGFDYVKEPGSSDIFRFKISSAGRLKVVQTHMQTFGTFVATQSAAIGRIKGFLIS